MTTTRMNDLSASIPLMRQFCFCMFGCQTIADDVIERFFLEFEKERFKLEDSTHTLGLFRLFFESRTGQEALSDPLIVGRPLDALHAEVLLLPIELRQAVLLVVTAGFTHEEAAYVLSSEADRVRKNVADAIDLIFSFTSAKPMLGQRTGDPESVWTTPISDPV